MYFFKLVLPLLAAQTVLGFGDFHERKQEHERRSANARKNQLESFTTQDTVAAAPKFLNKKTQKYKVDGKGLPLIDFDIGESYSGLLPIDDTGRELFFWFFPASKKSGEGDVTIWLNGGPGCSSLEGLFEENGPFTWRPGTYGPTKNPYSYNKLSNVVYIEQPVGTGYSQGKPNATNEVEVAQQFNAFWKKFVDLFGLEHRPVYITGESYAGAYVPYIGDGMLKEKNKKYYNLKGILIYDPVIGNNNYILPASLPAAEANAGSFPFSPSFWKQLREKQEKCGYNKFLKKGLQYPPKGDLGPLKYESKCDLYNDIVSEIYGPNKCFNIYHVSETCPVLSDIMVHNTNGVNPLRTAYFNREDVKRAIHAPARQQWSECGNGVLNQDSSKGSATQNGPVKRIAEATNNVIVGHGSQDFILLPIATLLTLNNLVWHGRRGFDSPPDKPFYVPINTGNSSFVYQGTWTSSRGITFVEISGSGHMVPQYQPEASFRHLEVLLGRVPNLGSKVGFTVG